jgi:hypothetical protein
MRVDYNNFLKGSRNYMILKKGCITLTLCQLGPKTADKLGVLRRLIYIWLN